MQRSQICYAIIVWLLKAFENVFSKRQTPDEIPEVKVPSSLGIIDLIVKTGGIPSKSEARRLVQQGAVELDSKKIADINANIDPKNGSVLKIGKRQFFKITFCFFSILLHPIKMP